jgi:hypothetical protein
MALKGFFGVWVLCLRFDSWGVGRFGLVKGKLLITIYNDVAFVVGGRHWEVTYGFLLL